jgi:predicted PurR-regulated permease PerM
MFLINRRAASFTFTVATVLVVLYLIYLIRSTLFVFILALLFAYLLSPLVNLLDRFLPGRTRTPALALAYLIFVGVSVFLIFEIGSTVVEQASALAKKLPDMLAAWQQPTPSVAPAVNSIKDEVLGRLRAEVAQHSGDLVSYVPQFGLKFLSLASRLIYFVIVPILAFFFLKDANAMRRHVLDFAELGPRRELLEEIMADINLLLAHYMRSVFALSLAVFVAYSIFFSIMGVPYVMLLAAIGAMLEYIPMLGPATAGAIILVVTAVAGSHLLVIFIFLLIYRMFQDYMLSPHLMGHGVELHPLLILFGVFAGAEIAGIAGAFLSVPVLALVRILYVRLRRARLNPRMA